jgi:hypothetical protein
MTGENHAGGPHLLRREGHAALEFNNHHHH